jgi:apolipoprotein N-acyltransferase
VNSHEAQPAAPATPARPRAPDAGSGATPAAAGAGAPTPGEAAGPPRDGASEPGPGAAQGAALGALRIVTPGAAPDAAPGAGRGAGAAAARDAASDASRNAAPGARRAAEAATTRDAALGAGGDAASAAARAGEPGAERGAPAGAQTGAGVGARLGALGPGRRFGLAALAGAALTLAQPPFGLWPALPLGWGLLLLLIDGAASPRAAAGLGWAAGAGFFLTGLHWIGAAFLVEAERVWWHAPLMPVAIAALAGGLAMFWALGFWLARRFWPAGWRRAVALAAAMLAVEALRGVALTGFPWALQGFAWTATPPMQLAAVIGVTTLSGLTIAAAALPATASRRNLGPAAAAALALAAAWGWGAARLAAAPPAVAQGPVIRLVQPNVGQGEKWRPENARPIFDNLLDLTAAPFAGPAPALVVWPEVAVTFLFDESPEAAAAVAAAAPPGAAFAVGAVRYDRGAVGRRAFNSLLMHAPGGAPAGVYDKRRLTPFGEYVPYAWLLGALGIGTLGEGLSGFTPGVAAGPFAVAGLPPFAPMICYEIIFPSLVGEAARGADWILQVTNDSWFGDSAGPWQHLAIARARAVEQGVPVARAANTGVSAMIDPFGRLTATLGLGARGALDSALPAPIEGRTLYARLGEGPPLALAGCAAAALLLRRARRAAAG